MSEEKWFQARQFVPGALMRCTHGTDPGCVCVTRFNVDKNCPLTKKQRIATAATFEVNRMERLSEHDEQKSRLLSQISRNEEDVESIHDNEYQQFYGCLAPSPPIKPPKPEKRNGFLIGFIILVLFLMILLIMVNTNSWDSIESLYIKNLFASYHMIY